MAKRTKAIPTGYRTATPALVVRNAAAAIEYYTHVFGAVELSRLYGDDGIVIWRSELKIGNSIIHLCDEMPAFNIVSPITLGGSTGAIQLYLDDLDGVWGRAMEAGANVVIPIQDTYWGERTGRISDPFGHIWTLSKRVEAVSKAELSKRVAAHFAPDSDAKEENIPTVDIRNVDMSDDGNTASQSAK